MQTAPLDISSDALTIIERDFAGLYSGELGLSSLAGGQSAADAALATLDVTGYASRRSQVFPAESRGATVLSPYIRHNILTLDSVWKSVKDAPPGDRQKFRDELLWQEYARHLYARVGVRLFENLRFEAPWDGAGDGWAGDMLCVDEVTSELERDGWLVNQSRMWLASHWSVRNGAGWIHGQERMHRELIDGSRAANLLGWQWTVGAGTGKPYGFARWQVEKRAPGVCQRCPLATNCPIQEFPDTEPSHPVPNEPLLNSDPDVGRTTGPVTPFRSRTADRVLLTIDSLGDEDPALAAHPTLPALFVFNAPALEKLQLSARRLGFYLQTLQDLANRRDVVVLLGDPYEYASQHDVAVTYAPVPSFKKFTRLAEIYPYPWLRPPHGGAVRSFSAWRKVLARSGS